VPCANSLTDIGPVKKYQSEIETMLKDPEMKDALYKECSKFYTSDFGLIRDLSRAGLVDPALYNKLLLTRRYHEWTESTANILLDNECFFAAAEVYNELFLLGSAPELFFKAYRCCAKALQGLETEIANSGTSVLRSRFEKMKQKMLETKKSLLTNVPPTQNIKEYLLGTKNINTPLDSSMFINKGLAELGELHFMDVAEVCVNDHEKAEAYTSALGCLSAQYRSDLDNPDFIKKQQYLLNLVSSHKFMALGMLP